MHVVAKNLSPAKQARILLFSLLKMVEMGTSSMHLEVDPQYNTIIFIVSYTYLHRI